MKINNCQLIKRQKGISLIEIMVSIFVMTIVAVSIIGASMKYVQMSKLNKDIEVATLVGKQLINSKIRGEGSINSKAIADQAVFAPGDIDPNYNTPNLNAYNKRIQLKVFISDVPPDANNPVFSSSLKVIKVFAYPLSSNGAAQQDRLLAQFSAIVN